MNCIKMSVEAPGKMASLDASAYDGRREAEVARGDVM